MYTPTKEDLAKLDVAFTYHAPVPGQPVRYTELRAKARELAELALTLCPPSRERSIGMTGLEDAVMWLNASIARNEHIATQPAEANSG